MNVIKSSQVKNNYVSYFMINLFILTGGTGEEHDVSLNSSLNISKFIDTNKFQVFIVIISKFGEFMIDNIPCYFNKGKTDFFCVFQNNKIHIDYIFPIIHGKGTEDGSLQGYFNVLGYKNIICNNMYSSTISFDKIIAKNLAQFLNIPIVKFIDYILDPSDFFESCKKLKTNYLFLKPSDNGSSVGCYSVSSPQEFELALDEIFKISKYPIIEKSVDVIECSCSVLYGEVSDVIIIEHGLNFFSYQSKYLDHKFKVKILKEEYLSEKIKEYSLKLYRSMKFDFMCRFDFFICKKTGEILFNEANSLPGLGKESLFFNSFARKYNEKEIISKMLNVWIENNSYN